jgi:Putative Flp pilus-assembly TadE/G-like
MQALGKQRGITLVTIAIAIVAVIAVAGMALDISHVVVNKSRLQATVDAAALSAAKVLDTTGSTSQATTAANSVFALNAAQHPELSAAGGSVSRTIEYSNTLIPFSPGTVPPLYVRVTATGFSLAATLTKAVGFNTFTIGANAIAGPSPTIDTACNIAPMMVCGTSGSAGFGYSQGQITALKLSAGSGGADIGPGNYRLLSLNGTGANVVRQNLAGSYNSCATVGTNALTQPGDEAGPVAQGLNTRFNEYQGGNLDSATYPPDVITYQPTGKNNRLSCQDSSCNTIVTGPGGNTVVNNAGDYGGYSYEGMYLPHLQSALYDVPPAPNGNGVVDRRILAVPVGDCSVTAQGRSDIPVLGLACIFLLQDVDTSGKGGQVFGEILSNCQVNGTPGPTPKSGSGPYIIQLYHVAGSSQS